ncbi:nucleotide sugar dehydrogenase [Mycobacterium sp. SMC-8]|nr:nucleotide sugar dehydrogenase [Mycobacterium sp. SMC-8]
MGDLLEDAAALGPIAQELLQRIDRREVTVGVIGLGYVGLPLAIAFAEQGITALGYDIDADKIDTLASGESYLKTVKASAISDALEAETFLPVNDISQLNGADAILICVPTPLSRHREPDLSYVDNTVASLVPHVRQGQALVLVSTTYPGTTDEVVRPHLADSGLTVGEDIFLIYAPEREDPGNQQYDTASTPKVVGGENADALAIGCALFGLVIQQVVPVSSLATAEAVKLTENIFRSVNIALVNELKILYNRMGIDVWEVIDAAKTKPFGYMPFYPGPGLGGHCIPIDPFYLTWKAREFGMTTHFIELAGQINNNMPEYVLQRLSEALDANFQIGLNGARILLVGVSYKKNIDDTRESPTFAILELLQQRGAEVDYLDPYVSEIPKLRKYPQLEKMRSKDLAEIKGVYDAAVICTDHDNMDYEHLATHCNILVDTRNALRNLDATKFKVVKA